MDAPASLRTFQLSKRRDEPAWPAAGRLAIPCKPQCAGPGNLGPRLIPAAGTLGNVLLSLQAGPLRLVPGLGRLSLGLLGAPALVEHMRQVGCVHLSELLIVTQSGGQVPVFACG